MGFSRSLNLNFTKCASYRKDLIRIFYRYLLGLIIEAEIYILRDLKKLVKNAGFALINPQLELQCLCDTCYANSKISLR